MPSWSSIGSWRAPRRPLQWISADQWSGSFRALVTATSEHLEHCLRAWDQALDDIGGEPSREDWRTFRPLRLSREEDWSDWLAHLLAASQTGRFSARLFAGDAEQAAQWLVRAAEREVNALGHRADLVVHFADDEWIHLEVKVGDLELEKTPGTTQALRSVVGGTFRSDYLLLPAADVRFWDEAKRELGGRADTIQTLTWTHAAEALRSSVLERHEPLRWRVWAVTFLGAVEQRLLGYQCVRANDIASAKYRPSGADVERVGILEELLKERP